ncbi:hypothetical protein SAMN05216223_104336 [Actinacidiphila yanglinensis]|uniref:DUF2771 domain-containing protein n=1 Tax=Actinacidiphila yanglinensis TaxID=310779 RepID=A0A1H5Z697_9ACTN|nr:hypothetical protein [Actinacidiphila yanglinensis]SEG31881.1 hypothetical protein SAMN05216223_104336 [Actinacidiphila yanglinensis]
MSIRRTATALGAISLGLISLTACSKPAKEATVTVGSKSVMASASKACYAKGALLPQEVFAACLQAKPKHHITVPVGDTVRIGVDPAIADKGWLIVQNTSLANDELLKDKTYFTVDSAELFHVQDPQTGQSTVVKSVTLNIVESADTSGSKVSRVISFELRRDH